MTLNHTKYRLLFFGSSEFAVPTLLALVENKWQIPAVVTQPDRPKGRTREPSPTPVKLEAEKCRLTVLEFENLKSLHVVSQLKALNADLAVVCAYGQIIPAEILKTTRKGFLNVHPSPLPRYRGPSPIQYTILNGETKTAVTLMLMDEQMDHGPIIAQEEVEVKPDDDYPTLNKRLAQAASSLVKKKLPDWVLGKIETYRQDDRKATFTKILTREDGRINWKRGAEEIRRQIRAFTPWPGTWSTLAGQRHKIVSALGAGIKPAQAGQIRILDNRFLVGCGNDTVLEILELQPEGKSLMSALAFIRGHPQVAGMKFV